MLFVYGTLQDPDVLAAVLGRPVDVSRLQAASAPGYRAVAYPGRVYPALVCVVGDTAPGRIVDNLDALDIAVLDAYEGDEYRREAISVLVDGQIVSAEAYLPVISIAVEAPAWSLADWTSRHKPDVIASETGTAAALRRLSAQRSP